MFGQFQMSCVCVLALIFVFSFKKKIFISIITFNRHIARNAPPKQPPSEQSKKLNNLTAKMKLIKK